MKDFNKKFDNNTQKNLPTKSSWSPAKRLTALEKDIKLVTINRIIKEVTHLMTDCILDQTLELRSYFMVLSLEYPDYEVSCVFLAHCHCGYVTPAPVSVSLYWLKSMEMFYLGCNLYISAHLSIKGSEHHWHRAGGGCRYWLRRSC